MRLFDVQGVKLSHHHAKTWTSTFGYGLNCRGWRGYIKSSFFFPVKKTFTYASEGHMLLELSRYQLIYRSSGWKTRVLCTSPPATLGNHSILCYLPVLLTLGKRIGILVLVRETVTVKSGTEQEPRSFISPTILLRASDCPRSPRVKKSSPEDHSQAKYEWNRQHKWWRQRQRLFWRMSYSKA